MFELVVDVVCVSVDVGLGGVCVGRLGRGWLSSYRTEFAAAMHSLKLAVTAASDKCLFGVLISVSDELLFMSALFLLSIIHNVQ